TIFVRMKDANGELIATRSYFPRSFKAAVRQKTRWTIGIALQGWEKAGFKGRLATRYCLYRDRRILSVGAITVLAYATLLYMLLHRISPMEIPLFHERFWRAVVVADIALAVWRILVRCGVM